MPDYPPPDCRCYICDCCYHDHLGWNHDWTPKAVCGGSTLPKGAEDRLWCVLRRYHPWGCVYGEDSISPGDYATFVRKYLPRQMTGSMFNEVPGNPWIGS